MRWVSGPGPSRYYPITGVVMLHVNDNDRVVLSVLLVQRMNGCFLETGEGNIMFHSAQNNVITI